MEKVIDLLKQRHIRITPQRIGVYELIYAHKNKHLTADGIYGKMKKRFPRVSLATIYSILQLYVSKDLVSEIRITFDKSCYEARTDAHHHFFCRNCKKIYDIDLHPCPALQKEVVDGHKVEELHGYFYGKCRDCK